MTIMPVFKPLIALEEVHKKQAVDLYIATFYDSLRTISRDENILSKLLLSAFNIENHHVALLKGNVVSCISFSSFKSNAFDFEKEALIKHTGLIKGHLSYQRLKKAFNHKSRLKEGECFIESVVTDSAYRGLGIAYNLQKHLLKNLSFEQYLLEVAEFNFKAIRMFEEFGFIVEQRRSEKSFFKPNYDGKKIAMRKIIKSSHIDNRSDYHNEKGQ